MPPSARILSAVSAARSTLMSAHTTVAPTPASMRALAAPIPLPAPVITATRPVRSKLSRGSFMTPPVLRGPHRRTRRRGSGGPRRPGGCRRAGDRARAGRRPARASARSSPSAMQLERGVLHRARGGRRASRRDGSASPRRRAAVTGLVTTIGVSGMPLAHDAEERHGVARGTARRENGMRRPAVRAVRDRDHVGVERGDLLGRHDLAACRARVAEVDDVEPVRRDRRPPATRRPVPTRSSPRRSSRRTRASAVCGGRGLDRAADPGDREHDGCIPSGRYTIDALRRESPPPSVEPDRAVAERPRPARRRARRRARTRERRARARRRGSRGRRCAVV